MKHKTDGTNRKPKKSGRFKPKYISDYIKIYIEQEKVSMDSQSFRINRGFKVILNSTFHPALLSYPSALRITVKFLNLAHCEGLPTSPVSIFNPHGTPTATCGHHVGQGSHRVYLRGCKMFSKI